MKYDSKLPDGKVIMSFEFNNSSIQKNGQEQQQQQQKQQQKQQQQKTNYLKEMQYDAEAIEQVNLIEGSVYVHFFLLFSHRHCAIVFKFNSRQRR